MCGIIGVLANRDAAPIMVEALRRLEYRGYDSAGVATVGDRVGGRRIHLRRATGKLARLVERLGGEPLAGETGIGHTRWATHGAPNDANAHPHVAGPVAVVHNGIIENHRELTRELLAAGHVFESETDTEVVARLCAEHMSRGLTPVMAACETLRRLKGAYALCFLFEGEDDLLVCARRGSPLAIGYGEGEMFVGSDALALAPLTRRVAYLEEGDWAVLTRASAHVHDADDRPVERPVRDIGLDAAAAEKGGHPHFMAKEIHEQPAMAAYAVSSVLNAARTGFATPCDRIAWERMRRVTLVGCGTAHYACHVAKYWFESIARLPVEIDVASEFRYRAPPMEPGGVAIFVSQSGETADTLAALRHCRAEDQTVVGVVNVETSSIAREADVVQPIGAGPEIGVASTKAFTGQLLALAAMAVVAGRRRGFVSPADEARLAAALASAPHALAETIARGPEIARLAAEIATARDVLYIGRGQLYPLALEGALKLKELSYIHAEGYAAGELKHGPIALVDEATPIIALAPHDALFEKTASNVREVMARRGRVLLITDAEGAATLDDAWRTLVLPSADPFVAPIVYAPAIQLLAYHAAVCADRDVDQPRNLAKSVTVE